MTQPGFGRPCPCGTGGTYDACCGPLHRGAAQATTAEQLMRSRYSAYAVGEVDHVFRSWHPRTRPADLAPAPDLVWQGLEILEVVAGGADDDEGVVEFRARFSTPAGAGELRERSRFVRRAGRWVYVEGQVS